MLRTYAVREGGEVACGGCIALAPASDKERGAARLARPLLEYVREAVDALRAAEPAGPDGRAAQASGAEAHPATGSDAPASCLSDQHGPELPTATPVQRRPPDPDDRGCLPAIYDLEVSAAPMLQGSPVVEGGSEFQYHLAASQMSEPSPGFLREPRFLPAPAAPPLPAIAEQPEQATPAAAAEPAPAAAAGVGAGLVTPCSQAIAARRPDSGVLGSEAREASGLHSGEGKPCWDAGPEMPPPPPGMFSFASGRAAAASAACQAQAQQRLGDLFASPPAAPAAPAPEPAQAAECRSSARRPEQQAAAGSPAAAAAERATPELPPPPAPPAGLFSFASGRGVPVQVSAAAQQRAAALFADSPEPKAPPLASAAPAPPVPGSKRPAEGLSQISERKRGRPAGSEAAEPGSAQAADRSGSAEGPSSPPPLQLTTAAGQALAVSAGGMGKPLQLFAEQPGDAAAGASPAAPLLQMASGRNVSVSGGQMAKFAAWFAEPADGAAAAAAEQTPGRPAAAPAAAAAAAAAVAQPLETPKAQGLQQLPARARQGSGRLLLSRLGGSASGEKGGSAFKTPRLKFETPHQKGPKRQEAPATGGQRTAPSRLQRTEPAKRPEPPPPLAQGLLQRLLAEMPAEARAAPRLRTVPSDPEHLLSLQLRQEGEAPAAPADAAELLAALAAAGAPARLLSEAWVANALRSALWRLASLAQRWPAAAPRLLSRSLVLDELKRRFDWELRRGNQPVLRRVLERDEPPGRLMVLCVAEALPAGVAGAEAQLELTDGWYFARAVLDPGLAALAAQGRIQTGDKLRIAGAQISAGQPAPALEAAATSWLRLHLNGTHRAAPDARLGPCAHRSSITPLPSIQPGGGPVQRCLLLVQRLHPLRLWVSSSGGGSGGGALWTPKAHSRAQARVQDAAGEIEEQVAGRVRAEELARCRAELQGGATPQGERAYAQAVLAGDGELLGSRDMERHAAARRAAMEAARAERVAAELQRAGLALAAEAPRPCRCLTVSAVLHQDMPAQPGAEQIEALVKLWGAGEELDWLAEGRVYSATNLTPSARRGRLELSASSATRWQEHAHGPGSRLRAAFRPRAQLSLEQLPTLRAGACFDCRGVLLAASEPLLAGKQSSQWAFLADQSVADAGAWLLAVQLRGGLQALDWLDPGTAAGSVVSLRDVSLQGRDAANGLWQAAADENSVVAVERPAGRQAAGPARELAAWAAQQPALVEALRRRVRGLMDGPPG